MGSHLFFEGTSNFLCPPSYSSKRPEHSHALNITSLKAADLQSLWNQMPHVPESKSWVWNILIFQCLSFPHVQGRWCEHKSSTDLWGTLNMWMIIVITVCVVILRAHKALGSGTGRCPTVPHCDTTAVTIVYKVGAASLQWLPRAAERGQGHKAVSLTEWKMKMKRLKL